jgi:hypothetical protein
MADKNTLKKYAFLQNLNNENNNSSPLNTNKPSPPPTVSVPSKPSILPSAPPAVSKPVPPPSAPLLSSSKPTSSLQPVPGKFNFLKNLNNNNNSSSESNQSPPAPSKPIASLPSVSSKPATSLSPPPKPVFTPTTVLPSAVSRSRSYLTPSVSPPIPDSKPISSKSNNQLKEPAKISQEPIQEAEEVENVSPLPSPSILAPSPAPAPAQPAQSTQPAPSPAPAQLAPSPSLSVSKSLQKIEPNSVEEAKVEPNVVEEVEEVEPNSVEEAKVEPNIVEEIEEVEPNVVEEVEEVEPNVVEEVEEVEPNVVEEVEEVEPNVVEEVEEVEEVNEEDTEPAIPENQLEEVKPKIDKEEEEEDVVQKKEPLDEEEEEDGEEEVVEEENINFSQFTNQDMFKLWDRTVDFGERDVIIKEMERRKLFPSKELGKWEYETGAYPDTRDPEFLQKLLTKREFAESLQKTWEPQTDPCEDNTTFEVTPVQRFVSNFMSPKTPYMSCLLFHGVGVGKTCAGIQICEAWLEQFPYYEVFLVAPPTIQQGFFRTIFDISKVKIGDGDEPNTASQCTGDLYMRLTNTLYERDPVRIEKLVNRMIRRRYKVFGYGAFANFIRNILRDIPSRASEEVQDRLKKEYLRREFSGKLLVIDEAHNLRDIVDEKDNEDDFAGGKTEKSDADGGKKLTPFLRDVLRYSESMKLCLLTATPMYNSYVEIIFMLNLLLINDKKAPITEAEIFDNKGNITEKGKDRLVAISQRYVSFMRGENPISFPVRLFPENIPRLDEYPTMNPKGIELKEDDKLYFSKLPIVPIELSGESLKASIQFMRGLAPTGVGLNTMTLDKLVHAGNIVMPATESTRGETSEAYTRRTDQSSFGTVFRKESYEGEVRYRAVETVGAQWLSIGNLKTYSPKFDFLIRRVRQSEGCIFVYTRFVSGGALSLALALEANGYLPYGRKTTLLANGIQAPGGKQCALCPKKEKEHSNSDHSFTPAYYGLLTGDNVISPNNEQIIKAQRAFDNVNGVKMKIIIGSQIASEGVDLRFIRETHVIDSWYHLNKTEQILGRAIRYLSHCALPKEKRNNTVYLYAATLPNTEFSRETGDLYSYRVGFKKAVLVGNVTRIMKQSAIDCNLNKDAIVIKNQDPIRQEDSQHMIRENVNINDMPFTAVCDWIETCEYQCNPEIEVKEEDLDDSTYDEFSSRWRIHRVKERFKTLFSEQPFYQSEDIWNLFSDIPRFSLIDIMNDIINNKSFQVTYGTTKGYIRYCNGYYLFQPNVYHDLNIPLAIRVGKFPIKKDLYAPVEFEMPEIEENKAERVDTLQTIASVWLAIDKWVTQLANKKHYTKLPGELEQRRIEVSQDNQELLGKYSKIIEIIELFHESFHRSQNQNPASFRKALLFYFWDEWLSLEEQKFLIYHPSLSSHSSVMECIEENQYILGKYLINRLLNPEDNSIIYLCEQGTECQRSFVDIIEKDKSNDKIKQLNVIPRNVGTPYGFLASKNGTLVFKTEEPDMTGTIGRGKECGNVTGKTGHISQLITIGSIFQKAGKGNFGLDQGTIERESKVKNSIRACTLINLCIRLLDAEKISNKRWFLRPLQAYYTGHKGVFRSSYKK